MELTFEPIGDYCLVEPLNANETAGGIVLPDGAMIETPRGRVLKVGPGIHTQTGAFLEPLVKPGDIVAGAVIVKDAYGSMKWKEGGKEYLVVRSRDLMGKINENVAPKIDLE